MMRYEDASQTGSISSEVMANDDADHLAANDFGPATGNIIAGSGTITGATGTDMVGPGGHITAITGAGGTDTSFEDGSLEIAGQYGVLTIQTNGNYSYARSPGTPDGVSDVFTYTLANAVGATDSARLTINIGDLPMLQAQGTRVVPGTDGVVVLPAGVELSDIRVVGRDLVITLPDGSTMTIVDGAVFVPQLVLGGVEVPASNLAALLIGSEPQPAAGDLSPATQSSGGNFAIPLQPLDPGVPLGDLLPPTELSYIPPDFEEIQFLDEDDAPTIGSSAVNVSEEGLANALPDTAGSPDTTNSPTNGGVVPIFDENGDALTVALGTPSGSLTSQGVAITWAVSNGGHTLTGSAGANTVITVNINDAGVYTVTLLRPIDHPTGGGEQGSSFVVPVSVSDGENVTLGGTITVTIEDDSPQVTVNQTAEPTLVVDETDLGVNATGNFAASFTTAFGADGAAAGTPVTYALGINAGATGLTDTATGTAVVLSLEAGVVVGRAGAGGPIVFTVTVDGSGNVTLDQQRAVVHNDPADPDEPGASAATLAADNLVTLSATATDRDGDTASASVNIGLNLQFEDDGPSINPVLNANATVTVDESLPSTTPGINTGSIVKGDDPDLAGGIALGQANSGAAIVTANAAFGADGPAAAGSISYALTITNAASGVTLTDGSAINLQNVGGVIVGVVSGGAFNGQAAFAIAIDANTGVVTVEQYLSLDHPVNPDPNDPLGLGANTVAVTVTATDGDGDTATSGAIDISRQITFLDDGPSVAPVLNASATVTVDESGPAGAASINTGAIAKGDDPHVAGTGAIGSGNSGGAVINANAVFGADGPALSGSLTYALTLGASDTPLTLTDGSTITLQLVGGVVVGVVDNGPFAGQAAFAIAINSTTGVVSVEQYLSLDHPVNPNPNDPLGLGANTVGVTVTATDGDGDPVTSGAVDISGQITFLDDGPSVAPVLNANATVTLDETGPAVAATINTGAIVKGDDLNVAGTGAISTANSGGAVVNANALFGADGPAAGSPTYALVLGANDTPLTLTDGSTITLQLVGGVIVGVVDNGPNAGEAAFAIAINSTTGVVTVEQYLSLDHPLNPDPNDPLGLGANTVGVTVTATDGDGDPVTSGAVDISGQITFLDDGPSVNARLNTQTPIVVDESEPVAVAAIDTLGVVKGDDPDLAGGLAIGSGVSVAGPIDPGALFGADGPLGSGLSYALVVTNPASGLTTTEGDAINLVLLANGVVVGVVQTGAFAGQAAFAIQINSATGQITVEQYLSLDHPLFPFNHDEPVFLADGALAATVTVTDGDGDSVTSGPIDLGSIIRFEDDGPAATDEAQQDVAEGNITVSGTFDFVAGADGGGVTHINGTALVFGVGGWSQWIAVDDGQIRAQFDGSYEFQSDASGSGVTAGTFTVTDGDGDQVTANWAFNITDANFPTAGASTALLDDDGLAGGNPASTVGDIDANVGEVPTVNPSEAVFHGALNFTPGGDTPATIDFAAMHGTGGVVGTENVTYSWNAGTLTLTAVTVGGTRPGTTLFTLQLDDATSGEYTLTLNDNVLHAAGNDENDATAALTFTVTDNDGSTASNTLTITFDDDAPTLNVTQNNEASVILTTQDAETDGVPTHEDTAVSTANFGGVFGLTFAAGADGAATPTLSYNLNVLSSVSGMTSHGVAINLYDVGGVIVGSTALSAPALATDPSVVFSIAVSGTGVVTLTQYQQVDHAVEGTTTAPFDDQFAVLGNGLVTLTASSSITDADGDTATDQEVVDLGGNIRFADDGPDAVNDTANQVTENSAVTVNVFANDAPGADGVNLATGVTLVGGSLTGSGVLVYNNDGTFTYTPAAGEEGSVQFQYQLTDFDGDTDIATVTINLQPDSVPAAVDGVAKVDDDGLPAGVGDSATGDLDANSGEAPVVNTSEAVWHGQLVATSGGDTIANYSFASMHGTSGSVGTETVNYTWNNGTSTLTATISGGARNGTVLFDVVVNQATGSYNLTLRTNVLHVDEVANQENDATTSLTFTVTDSDGDPDTGTIVVTFDDDMPVVTSVTDPLSIDNDATPSGTGNFAFNIGADQNADFDDISVSGFTVTVNGSAATNIVLTPGAENATTANYSFTFDYDTGTGGTTTATGTLVFNKAAGTYTVELTNGPIQGFSILDTGGADASDFTSYQSASSPGGSPEITVAALSSNFFVQFTGVAEPGSGTGSNNLFTVNYGQDATPPNDGAPNTFSNGELFTQAEASVTVSSSAAGVSGNTIQGGEVLDFNLYATDPGSTLGLAPTASSSSMFLKFDGIGDTEDMIIILKLWNPDTNEFTTKAVMVQNSDIFKGPGTGPGVYSGITLDNNDGLVIIESNDYNAAGENWVIVGGQIAGSDEGITGTAINLNGAIGDAGASSGTQAFSTDVHDGPFKISSVGFLTESSEDQSATLEFDVTIEDADGDQVITNDITVNIGDPVSPASLPLSTLTTESQEQQLQKTAANSNTTVLAASLAAAGMTSAAAMDTNVGEGGHSASAMAMSVTPSHANFGVVGSQLTRAALNNEAKDFVADEVSSASDAGGPSMDAGNTGELSASTMDIGTPTELLDATDAPATQTSVPAPASDVGMPSAEAMVAAGLGGEAKTNSVVEKILAEALDGGGNGPDIDALLANLPANENGANPALEAGASHGDATVPAWDMGYGGGFTADAATIITSEAMALHPDAVQAV